MLTMRWTYNSSSIMLIGCMIQKIALVVNDLIYSYSMVQVDVDRMPSSRVVLRYDQTGGMAHKGYNT